MCILPHAAVAAFISCCMLVKKRLCSPGPKHCLNIEAVVLCTLGREGEVINKEYCHTSIKFVSYIWTLKMRIIRCIFLSFGAVGALIGETSKSPTVG